jgi:hypothetical protein
MKLSLFLENDNFDPNEELNDWLKQPDRDKYAEDLYYIIKRAGPGFDYNRAYEELFRLKNSKYVYLAGKWLPNFDHKKGFEVLFNSKSDIYGQSLVDAGARWPWFDYKRGFEALMRMADSKRIAEAGKDWKEFDHEKGLERIFYLALNKEDDLASKVLYDIGLLNYWEGLNHKKILLFLKKADPAMYQKALKDWPRGYEDTKKAIQKQKENSKPMPEKKFKLK